MSLITTAARKRPLSLEALEERAVPSTLTVTSNLNSGPGSLRSAIAAAGSGDTIHFASSLQGKTIVLSSELDVKQNLSIVGPGANQLTVSGKDASRVLDVAAGATLSVSGLAIVHGHAAVGAGIDNAGNLTIRNSLISDNQAVGGLGGGGIHNADGASLTLDHSVVRNNQATAAHGQDVFGGGLLNEGSATVTATTFSGNQALGGGGNPNDFFNSSTGGGIDNYGGADLTVTGCTFSNNQAVGIIGVSGASGGALDNNSGPDQSSPSTASISNSLFVGNVATGGLANGGAIDNEGKGATLTLDSSTLIANRSQGNGNNEGLGGALMNVLGANFTVTNSKFIHNQAIGGDHQVNLVNNPPTGSGQGGAMVNAGATLTVMDSTLVGNQALGGKTGSGPGGAATGGAISNWGTALTGMPSVLTVSNCTLTGNQAIAGQGGPTANAVVAGFAAGGAIDNSFSGTAIVIDSTLTGNQAVGGAGGSGVNGGIGLGGGISVGFSTLLGLTDNSTIQMSNSVLTGNLAQGGTGGKNGRGGDGLGGGLAITAGSGATDTGSTFKNNQALGGKGGPGWPAGHGIGGGVYDVGTFAFDLLTVITRNRASTSNSNTLG